MNGLVKSYLHPHILRDGNRLLSSISIIIYAPNEPRHENVVLPVLADCLSKNIIS
jgi:hypothetical protein